MMHRLFELFVGLLCVAFTVVGLSFLSMFNPAGIMLGLLCLGAATLLYLLYSLQQSVKQHNELLSLMVAREWHGMEKDEARSPARDALAVSPGD